MFTFKLDLGEGIDHPDLGLGTNIVNLTGNTNILTSAEKSLLDRGLNFVPTPQPKTGLDAQLDNGVMDTEVFGHKMKLADYFRHSRGEKIPFTENSGWSPPNSKVDPEISKAHKKIIEKVRDLTVHSNQQNLSVMERRALNKLRKNRKIVIKPADKGSATVILSRENYIREAHRQLNNPKYYKKLDKAIWPENCKKFNTIIECLKDDGHINKKQAKYLEARVESQTRKFYLLPKIHKPVNSWTDVNTPPGRPIISDCGSESYNISEYIDYHLKPIANRHKSFVKNTEDLLSKLSKTKIPKDSFLVTLDIDSMYTNIDIDAGIDSVKRAFDKYPDTDRPDENIIELLELSLKGNDFEFNGEIYQQVCGCAMGKRFSPNFASIYVAEWEEAALNKSSKQPLLYLRYLDDILIIWQHSKQEFWNFLDLLNQQDDNIKLKATISDLSVDFLDVTIYKGIQFESSGYLDYKVYFKPTDTHQLLHSKSFHPKHTFKGIVKSQIIRFHRNSSNKQNLYEACSILFSALKSRGYSTRSLRKIKSETVRELENPIISIEAYKPFKLQHNHPPHMVGIGSTTTCNKPKCRLHDIVKMQSTFKSDQTKIEYQIRTDLDCDSENVIYLITCNLCKKQYVGQTQNRLRIRLVCHKYSIRHEENVPVANHFNLPGHSLEEHFEIVPIEQTPILGTKAETDLLRLERESFWIRTLETKKPFGINVESGKSVERDKMIFPILYSRRNVDIGKIMKEEFLNLQTVMKNPITARPVIAYRKNPSLKDMLVSTRLPA